MAAAQGKREIWNIKIFSLITVAGARGTPKSCGDGKRKLF
jgi:hypothetical protein